MFSMSEFVSTFGSICLNCLTFGTSGFYLLYATIVLLTGLLTPSLAQGASVGASGGQNREMVLGDIGRITVPGFGEGSIVSKFYVALMNFFNPLTYLIITEYFLKSIRWVLGLGETGFDYWRVFKRLIVFYFLVIPLPAAFLPPIGYPQAPPDAHLLTAIVLLIFVNAVGDLISARITIRNFERVASMCRNQPPAEQKQHLKQGALFELKIYLTTVVDMIAAIAVLCVVLMFSSVLFGVQIGVYTFSLELDTLVSMWGRAVRFPELASEMYWFRQYGDPSKLDWGIPGMLIYGASTFIPTIFMLCSALFWSATIPLRIVLQLPKSKIYRILSAELSVFVICLIVSIVFSVSIPGFYSFLTTIWTT